MKFRIMMTELAAVVPGDSDDSISVVRNKAKLALAGFTVVSRRKPKYLGRGQWQVPLADVVIATAEADSGEEAIKKICRNFNLRPEGLKAVVVPE